MRNADYDKVKKLKYENRKIAKESEILSLGKRRTLTIYEDGNVNITVVFSVAESSLFHFIIHSTAPWHT